MFEKIPSLKDFIIYFMPGVLTCFFMWDLFNRPDNIDTAKMIYKNSVLVFISIVISFLVGFLVSQMQIVVYGLVLKKKLNVSRTINGQRWSDDLKNLLVNEVKKRFDLSMGDDELKNDKHIVFFCEHYILVKSTENGQRYIDRSKHLSSFACASVIPVVLGIIDLCRHTGADICCSICIGIIAGTAIAVLAGRILLNFRCGGVRSDGCYSVYGS